MERVRLGDPGDDILDLCENKMERCQLHEFWCSREPIGLLPG